MMRKTIRALTLGSLMLILAAGLAQPSVKDTIESTKNKMPERAQTGVIGMKAIVSVEWEKGPLKGSIEVRNGKLESLKTARGAGKVKANEFACASAAGCRFDIEMGHVNISHSANPTVVSITSDKGSFSFLVRDVMSECPIFIPQFGVAVTTVDDLRSYKEIADAIKGRGGQTRLQQIESEPEESFEESAAHTRKQRVPTWLGLSRDMRIFEVSSTELAFTIMPRSHGYRVPWPEGGHVSYIYYIGRGAGCSESLVRRLEEGVLPILRGKITDDDVVYNMTAFVVPETSKLTSDSLRGTHYLVADGHGYGHMFTEKQQAEYDALAPGEINRDEETVLFMRYEAVNTGSAPRYAWFKTLRPEGKIKFKFEGESGLGVLGDDTIYAACRLNGAPVPKEETAVLLAPGKSAVFEMLIPHSSINRDRAAKLAKQDFEARRSECRKFWEEKLASAAKIHLPDKRMNEMVQAGLLHLDIIAYGLEPDGPVAPTIGVYCPIGSESSPIIQFIDSMGWSKLAERSLEYFLEKQHDDGFMQNFGGYMLETGAALWSMGEHYRYTRDDAWLKRVAPKLIKSCDYLIDWRKRNLREELKGRGYGMLEGKVADPEDPFHIFMLNGYAYLGLSRVAEILSESNPKESARLAKAAADLKQDIRNAFFESMAKSPVAPLGDGTWCPTSPPWAEAAAPAAFLIDNANWFSHGTVGTRDSLLGPLFLVFQEVVDPNEDAAKWLIDYHAEIFHMRNAAFSQPYYSPHPRIHLRMGQVKPFLKAYFNSFSGLADRDTYTFWEHIFFVSSHKTHEEGWFLMQTRWMLYMEDGETLKLLPGVPRAWLEHGKRIELDSVATYFGPVSLKVESLLEQGVIRAEVICSSNRKPKRIALRLPHPQGRKAIEAIGGTYDASTETVTIETFKGRADVTLRF
ncbi:MAG: hypothetical protein Q7N50_02805 [Armatimonadota bacterium]|nr:hypothetical protein [Armatimonadota bacterium]